MELRDYLRMLRRGWPTVLLVTALAAGLAVLYLAAAPKQYQATAVLFVTVDDPGTISELQQGAQFAANSVQTYADVVDSARVLGPVADEIRPSMTVDQIDEMVTATARTSKTLIDVTATGERPRLVANVANAAARSAVDVLPALDNSGSTPLVAVQVVADAPEPTQALSPVGSRVLALGLVVGVFIGLGLTIATQALDTRLRRPEDLVHLTKLPLLAVLPRLRRSQRASVVVRDDPASPAVEAYRSLRTNLAYLESGQRRSLLFAGVAEDRAGFLVPVNLAWSIAQAGRRVLLIDLDLRQSLVGDILERTPGPGMADVLAGSVELHEIVHETVQPGFHVALSGTPQPSPSDLLSGPVMANVLRLAEKEYDYVVLHAPPLLTYTDAAVVSRVAAQTLVTVSAGRTRAAELSTALGILANVRVEPLGIVLAGSRAHVGDMNKVRGIWTRPRPGPPVPSRRVQWDWLDDGAPSRRASS